MFAVFRHGVKALVAYPRAQAGKAIDRGAVAGHHPGMLIYKILRAHEWAELEAAGESRGAPVDLADGFIHFSTASQLAETARRHFAGAEGLVLAAVETDRLGDALKWEPSRGGEDFPHLYASLPLAAVVWTRPMPLRDGVHVLPEEVQP